MSILHLFRANSLPISLMLGLATLPICLSSVLIYTGLNYETTLRAFPTSHWIVFFLASSCSMALALTPTTFIALLSGYFLGWSSIIYFIPAYSLASWISYWCAQKVLGHKFKIRLQTLPTTKKIIDNINARPWTIVFLARLSPVLPFAMTNVLLASLEVKIKPYLLSSLAGMLPRTLLAVWLGNEASYLKEAFAQGKSSSIWQTTGILLIILSLSGLFFFLTRNPKTLNS